MKYTWLNKKNNDKIVTIFNGWGMDENILNHLAFDYFDVVMFYDYNNLETDFIMPDSYKSKHLIAWSMGVMIATNFDFGFDTATAINGTLKPIDIKYGIHPKIYDLTIKGFNEKGRERFVKSMFLEPTQLKLTRTLENQKSELEAIKRYKANEEFKYTRVIISDNDKIIPTKSQCDFWSMEPNLHAGHCPFYKFTRWSELL